MVDSIRASKQGLKIVDQARAKKRWNKQAATWQDQAFVSLSTLKRFWERKPILQQSFIDICNAVGINWEEVVELEESQDLQDSDLPLLTPEFYIEREPIESVCYKNLWQDGSLIRIKALRHMGKTLLIDRLLVQLVLRGFRIVNLSFKLAEREHYKSLDKLLRWFCIMTTRDLDLPNQLADYWDEEGAGSKVNCTAYWEEYILLADESPIVLALDDVDLLFPYPEIYEDFFALLRFWHERAKNRKVWQKLRLIIAYSTESYIPLNIDQSPFNVGIPIELPEFNLSQAQNLAKLYGLDWHGNKVQQLISMIGGHPLLLEQTFIHLQNYPQTSLSELLENAPKETGIYSDHLRQNLLELQKEQGLAQSFSQVVNTNKPIKLDPISAYRLNRMGLVKLDDDGVEPRCQLYRLYFHKFLGEDG